MIALVFALKFEARAAQESIKNSQVRTWILNTCGQRVMEPLERLISKNPPQAIFSAGLAGGLDETCARGTIVLGKNYTDERFLRRLEVNGAAWRTGAIHTVSQVVDSAATKRRIGIETGALCCDMETAHIWKVASAHGIPLLAVRAINDPAGQDLPVPGAMLIHPKTSRPDILAMLLYLLQRPSRVPEFFRMIRAAEGASRNLSRVLHQNLVPIVLDALRA